VGRVGGVDPLRREGDADVAADLEAGLGQRLDQQVAGGADVAGRGEDDRLPATGVTADRLAGAAQGGEVRSAVGVDRGRHADHHRVGLAEPRLVAGQVELRLVEGDQEPLVVGRRQVATAAADLVQPVLGDVDPEHAVAGVAQGQRRRQADVAEADDRDQRRPGGGRRASRGQFPSARDLSAVH
jgi:hypothetical protein